MEILIPIITMGALGLLFSAGLALAYQKLKVEEDPAVEKIAEILPQANCGACGYSGCHAFAQAVAAGKTEPSGCPVGGDEVSSKIAQILGVEAAGTAKKIARLHCRGTHEAAKSRGQYIGITTCEAAHLVGGNKQCVYGCMGYGDCVRSCPFDAIHMGPGGLPVVDEQKCTACGKCVDACPRNLLELHPVNQNILVFCRSREKGASARKACKNACIACGICEKASPEAIVVEDNLAVIKDVNKIEPEQIEKIEKCPTGAIGLIEKEKNEG